MNGEWISRDTNDFDVKRIKAEEYTINGNALAGIDYYYDVKYKRYEITCSVYGAMAHTAYAGDDDLSSVYEGIKSELAEFMDLDTTEDDEMDFYERLTSKW